MPDDSFVAGELGFIGDDPTVNSILLAMCIFFCNIRNRASLTQNEAIEVVLRSAKWVSIEDAEYVAETWLQGSRSATQMHSAERNRLRIPTRPR